MIHPFPRYFFVLSWILLGPSVLQPLLIAFFGGSLVLALALLRSFRYRTIALLSILGVMLVESFQTMFLGLHVDLFEPHLFHEEVWNFFSSMLTIDLVLSIAGVLAAACAAVYIEFGKSRMSVANIFPDIRFLEAPEHVRNVVDNLARSAGIQSSRNSSCRFWDSLSVHDQVQIRLRRSCFYRSLGVSGSERSGSLLGP